MTKIKNFKIDKKNKIIKFSIDPRIFPLEIVYSAAYVLMNDAYVILDGNPEKNILVQIKAKKPKQDLEKLALEFNNELLNYAVYSVQAAKTQEIRKAIVQRALMTNTIEEEELCQCEECRRARGEIPEEPKPEIEFIDDPEGIAKPWTPEMAKGLEEPSESQVEKLMEETMEEMKPEEYEIEDIECITETKGNKE